MSTVTRNQLLPGVYLTSVHTTKFKSSVLSMTLLTPLTTETAAVNSLIPHLLRRGSEAHPDMQSLSAALDELYGGSIEPAVRKRGETQCVGFVGSFLDDAYTPDHSCVLEQAANLMVELLLHPCTENGVFRADYTQQEKNNLTDRIRAELNDKRQYAVTRLIEEMCAGEPYGISSMGRENDVDAISPQSAWNQYRTLLAHSKLELYYCGSAETDKVCCILQTILQDLPRCGDYSLKSTLVKPHADNARQITESLDVAQGKLTMGFRTGGITMNSPEYPALILCNALFGGTTTSKLFLNVREKLSLCYYASSSLDRYKGLMLVSSGVEFSDKQQAEDEILAQLEACRCGEFEPWEVTGARSNTTSSLMAIPDSQSRQEDWWISQAVAGLNQTPQDLAQAVADVTVDAAIKAAKSLSLDTVYFLKGTE